MISDLRDHSFSAPIECDICIVGTGAAGLALAMQLLDSRLKVVILESGAKPLEDATQALYDCDITGLPFTSHLTGRYRVYGGSTTKWGGQSLPLTPQDFSVHPAIAHSGWPIPYDTLAEPYARAVRFLMTDTLDFDGEVFSLLRFQPPAFDSRRLKYHYSKWSPRPDLRQVYGPPLGASQSVSMLMHANLTLITLNEAQTAVYELEARSLEGKRVMVRPRHTVLCTGGIETPRILLSNRHQQSAGLGNGNDLVGRYFQDHPTARLGRITSAQPDALQRVMHTFYRKGLKYAPRLSLAADAQREHGILNASAAVEFDLGEDAPYTGLKRSVSELLRRRPSEDTWRGLARGLLHLPEVAEPIWKYLVQGRGYTPEASAFLCMFSEQEPNPKSRITLSTATDTLGLPKAQIHWQLTDLSHKTARTFASIAAGELARLGLGTLTPEPWLAEGTANWQSQLGPLGHHIGTTRMSDSPKTGVVDPECRVHGLQNLWIAGSSVFPTGGHSNPTLTLLALTMRLADTLKRTCQH